jgi:hypothetical protein
MDPTIFINEGVDVVSIFNSSLLENSVCVPWKMKYKTREIVFTKLAMRHPTAKGRRMIHVFDMSDGVNDYRLEFDAERLVWNLISMVPGNV